jgi:hypothetical protein
MNILVHERMCSFFAVLAGRLICVSLVDGNMISECNVVVEKVMGIFGKLIVFGFASGALSLPASTATHSKSFRGALINSTRAVLQQLLAVPRFSSRLAPRDLSSHGISVERLLGRSMFR